MPRAPRSPGIPDPVKGRSKGAGNKTAAGKGTGTGAGTVPPPRRRTRKPPAELLASHAAAEDHGHGGRMISMRAFYALIAWIFLLPACIITTHALTVGFGDSMGHSFWRTPAFWFFGMGLVLWLITFMALPRPVILYVWAHEMTHAIFVILCGGKVRKFHCTSTGGYVLTDKNNVLIALAPYFFPLYTVILVPVCLIAGAFTDLTVLLKLPGGFGFRPLWGLFLLMGVTWGFHLTFTLWMIAKDQPDLRINGVFFSFTLIYLINSLLLALLLILAAPELSLPGFTRTWREDSGAMIHAVRAVWSSAWRMGAG